MSYSRANRPSPSVSATLYGVGDRMRGNDGNMYQIVQSYKGTNRWSKLAKDSQYEEGGQILHKVREPEKVIEMLEDTGLYQDFMNADNDGLRYNIFQNAEEIISEGVYAKGGKLKGFIKVSELKEYLLKDDANKNESYKTLNGDKYVKESSLRTYMKNDEDYAKGGKIEEEREELTEALSSLSDDDFFDFLNGNGFEQIDIPNIDAQSAEIESFINGNNDYEKPLTANQMKEYTEEIKENIAEGWYETYYAKGGDISDKKDKWGAFWKKSKELGQKGYKKSQELAKDANERRKIHNHDKREGIAKNVIKETVHIVNQKAKKGSVSKTEALNEIESLKKGFAVIHDNYKYPEGPKAAQELAEKRHWKMKKVRTHDTSPYFAKGGQTDPIKLIISPDEYAEKVLGVLDDYGVKYGEDPEKEMDNRMAEGMSYVIYDMDEEDIDNIVDELNHRKEGSFVFYRGDDPGNGEIESASGSFAKGGEVDKEYVLDRYYVYVNKDSWEEGQTEEVAHWDSSDYGESNQTFSSKSALMDFIKKVIERDTYEDNVEDKYFNIDKDDDDTKIDYSVLCKYVDLDRGYDHYEKASDEEIEKWKKGELELVSVGFTFAVSTYSTRVKAEFEKGGKVKKGNEMLIGGLAGFLLGMFFVK
jgi:hypothetical protein